ncbi:hypothetical protein V3391_12225 [Luteimonas sp. SMYT11W]|uniref:DUF3617 family protein n=1 Tax=Luteimonas flava TaxID=3115822 RepID=A0ABU7WGX1_9GAMM
MSGATSPGKMHIQAGYAFALLVVMASFVAPVRAQHYVVEWPAARQHLLEGRYTGSVRDEPRRFQSCEFQTAELLIQSDRRYVISLRCDDDPSRTRTIRGGWWIDEIAGSCLILIGPDASPTNDDYLYGFRIHDAALELHQDGGRCQSADERDTGMILVRLDTKAGS